MGSFKNLVDELCVILSQKHSNLIEKPRLKTPTERQHYLRHLIRQQMGSCTACELIYASERFKEATRSANSYMPYLVLATEKCTTIEQMLQICALMPRGSAYRSDVIKKAIDVAGSKEDLAQVMRILW